MSVILTQLQSVLDWIVVSSVQASMLIGVILLLRLVLGNRLSSRWRNMLWLLLFVRLSMPYVPDSSMSIYNVFTEQNTAASTTSGNYWQAISLHRLGVLSQKTTVDTERTTATQNPPQIAESKPAMNITTMLLFIWLGGASLVAIFILWRTILLKVRLRKSCRITDLVMLTLLADCKTKMGVRNEVRLEETLQLKLPILHGVFRPRLLFPVGMLDTLTKNEIRHIFLHELAHHKRRDILLNWWMMLIRSLNWFNPLVWYACAKARMDAELACDALALSRIDDTETRDYGFTLIRLLEMSAGRRRSYAPTGVLRNRKEVRTRLGMIADYRRSSWWSTVLLSGAAVVLGVLFLTNAQGPSAQNDGLTSSPSAASVYAPTIYAENAELAKAGTFMRRDGGRVWLEGVDHFAGQNQTDGDSYIRALLLTLAARGEKITYDQLIGISGAAFRFQFYQPDWCPSAQNATFGFDCATPAARAFGYTLETWEMWRWDSTSSKIQEAQAAIVESIDNGCPVIAVNLVGEFTWEMNWGVIVGYEDNGRVLLTMENDEYVRVKQLPKIFQIPIWENEAPAWNESVLHSLRIASLVARADSFNYYASGFAAYEAWIEGLLDNTRFESLDDEQLNRYLQSNAFCYRRLVDNRAAAARYLESVKGEFDGELADYLSRAQRLYGQIAQILQESRNNVPSPSQLTGKSWSNEMRTVQADVLRDVLALEREAIETIEAAVSLGENRKGSETAGL